MSAMQLTLDMRQRWLFGKPKYRFSRETIRPGDSEIAEIPDDTTARDFISKHHYSGSMGAARVRVGLYRHGELVGVAVFSHPCSDAVLTRTFPVPPSRAVELGCFVLLDEVEANAETYLLARAFEILRGRGIAGVVTFSDPLPRRKLSGGIVLPGHFVESLFRLITASTSGAVRRGHRVCCRTVAYCTSEPSRRFALANVAGRLALHSSSSSARRPLPKMQTNADSGWRRTSACSLAPSGIRAATCTPGR